MHRKALALLAKLGQAERGGSGGGRQYLEQMVLYLAALGAKHMALVLEFSRWVLAEDQPLGLRIFTMDVPGTVPLEPQRVLAHLKGCSLQSLSAGDSKPKPLWQQHALAVDYLEFLITEHDPPSTGTSRLLQCVHVLQCVPARVHVSCCARARHGMAPACSVEGIAPSAVRWALGRRAVWCACRPGVSQRACDPLH